MFLSLIVSFFALILGLGSASLSGAQISASDTERRNDINSIYQKLEERYNEYGDYPTLKELDEQGADLFPGIDTESLIDPNGDRIQLGNYSYSPAGCSATGCNSYSLTATLNEGTNYTKQSLN
jgi:hypothetical protein